MTEVPTGYLATMTVVLAVMLTKAGPKLLDFGVAQTRAGGEAAPAPAGAVTSAADPQLTTPGTVLGTVQYMSTEQMIRYQITAPMADGKV